jgi:hypothetical protein
VEYKVWVHVEEVDESVRDYRDATEPTCAGVFDTLAEAEAFIERIAGGVSPELPNQLVRACKKAEDTFRTLGESQGFGLMGPKCWAVIEELRRAIADLDGS